MAVAAKKGKIRPDQGLNPMFCQRLIESCERFSDRLAMRVVGERAEDVTFGEMLQRIRSIAFKLGKEGVEPGERVAVIGENHPAWAVSYLGILYAGAVCVPLDPHGEIQTLTNFIQDSESKVVFVGEDFVDRLEKIEETLGRPLRTVIWNRTSGPGNGIDFTDMRSSFTEWSKTEFPSEYAEQPTPSEVDDNAVLIYTSGTTGKPKGVLLTHGNINSELDAIDGVLEFTDRESVLSLLPLFHAYLQIVNLWLAATKGATVFYLKELSPDELSKAMVESKMTALASVPRLWYLFHKKIFDAVQEKPSPIRLLFRVMLAINGFTRNYFGLNLGKVFFKRVHDSFGGRLDLAVTAGSRFDESVAIDFHNLGFTIVQGYGLSETSGAATGTYIDDNRVGSVGKPMGDAEVRIDSPDENGEGEVQIRGSMVFKGYYKNAEATKESFTDDGWFKSGDLGKFDKDGHLYITGRAKDVIVLPSGKNVHPEDLEVHYQKSPLVEEICVVGVPDESSEHAGAEKLLGVVVPDFEYLKQSKVANSGEAIRFELDNLGRELPEYQRVRDYVIRSEPIPRTATRKIKRFELRKELSQNGRSDALAETKQRNLTESDEKVLESPAGRALQSLISAQMSDEVEVHPDMNLEIDLRLDSLERAEIVAGMEQAFKFEFAEEEITQAFTFREVVALVEKEVPDIATRELSDPSFNWSTILAESQKSIPETKAVLKRNVAFEILAFVCLKAAYAFFLIVLRLDVRGAEHVRALKGAFLICPNHQSYVDPIVICSTYPFAVLRNIFHVGASEYFQGFFTRLVGRLLRIVPVDPDTQLLKAMKAGATGLRAGRILNIYPEGERAFDGELHKFKNGAAILSSELGLPIVPVAIDGLHKVWGRKSLKIRAAKVRIEFCEPLRPEAGEDYDEITARLKNIIGSKIDAMRDD